MSYILSFLAAVTAPQAAEFPQPVSFIRLAETPLAYVGFGECLSNYGSHLLKGTSKSVDAVIEETVEGCAVVRGVAFRTLTTQGSGFREAIAEKTGREVSDVELTTKLELWFDQLEARWTTEFQIIGEEFRKSESYDPKGYMAQYNADLASGKLSWGEDDD